MFSRNGASNYLVLLDSVKVFYSNNLSLFNKFKLDYVASSCFQICCWEEDLLQFDILDHVRILVLPRALPDDPSQLVGEVRPHGEVPQQFHSR